MGHWLSGERGGGFDGFDPSTVSGPCLRSFDRAQDRETPDLGLATKGGWGCRGSVYVAEADARGGLGRGVSVDRMWRRGFHAGVFKILILIVSAAMLDGRVLSGSSTEPGCYHWAVFRVCQLHRLPVAMQSVMDMLRARIKEHSMRDLAEVFDQLGFKCNEAVAGSEVDTEGERAGLRGNVFEYCD